MSISIWRYSHLVLSIVTSIFLLILSVTGIILSVEPIQEKTQGFYIENSSSLRLKELIIDVKNNYENVIGIEVDKNGFVLLETEEQTCYINPFTTEKIGEPKSKSRFFGNIKSLHRSLFMNALGRAFIGIVSFLFFFILLSGIVLIIKRQNGVKNFFAKIVRDSSSQYYHIIFGRLLLIPLLVLSITGTYLSLKRFKIIPAELLKHEVDLASVEEPEPLDLASFKVFNQYTLAEVRKVSFPLFEDVEEIYKLQLKDRELYVNQFDGSVISERLYPFSSILKELSFNLHTGQGSILWSLILGLSMLSIPYFIYSGFVMTFARRKGRIKNIYKKSEAEFIILVGSENGSTQIFAKMLHQGLLNLGKKSFIADMNSFTSFDSMKYLLVLTSTYGVGEAPANASRFIKLFNEKSPKKPFEYAVVGFGSLSYPDYCKFAYDVESCIKLSTLGTQTVSIHTVNNKSFESYSTWVTQWGNISGNKVVLPAQKIELKRKKTTKYRVVSKTKASESPDDTFLIELVPQRKQKFISGDLIAIYPEKNPQERLYSLAVYNNHILLSVKRHLKGVCSNYLNDLKVDEVLDAYIVRNKEFYLSKKSKRTIMIATGTGIAPFLGIIHNNRNCHELYLYWGAKNSQSLALYQDIIHTGLHQKRLAKFIPAYSRETDQKIYVQNLVERDHQIITETLQLGGEIMICGSIAMQKQVMEILSTYSLANNKKPLSYYTQRNQIKIDCY